VVFKVAYTKQTWKDRVVEKPMTFNMQTNADGTITLIPAEGQIVESGTPINANYLNNLEKQYDEAINYINAAPTWTNATLQNGWVNYGVTDPIAGYVKVGNIIRIRGIIKDGIATSNTTVFTLPTGYRPSVTSYGTTICSGNVIVRVVIRVTGEVVIQGTAINNAWVQLDNITFTL
jgi:hypothetical protein